LVVRSARRPPDIIAARRSRKSAPEGRDNHVETASARGIVVMNALGRTASRSRTPWPSSLMAAGGRRVDEAGALGQEELVGEEVRGRCRALPARCIGRRWRAERRRSR
jgi:hypothetical protein